MITKRVRGKKNPVTIISSSYFEDIKMIDEGMRETRSANYIPRWERSKGNQMRNLGELELANVVMKIQLAKKGIREVADFAEKIPAAKLKEYEFNYGPCIDSVSYEDLLARKAELTDELAAAKDAEEKDAEERVAIQEDLEAVEKEIKSFDDFVERNMTAIAEAEVMEA